MKIVIPMAGLGTRFQKEAGRNPDYARPKPFIPVRGLPMIRWATGSLPFIRHPGEPPCRDATVEPKDITFVILREHDETFGIAAQLKQIYSPEVRVVLLPRVTRGAAETVYQAREWIAPDEALIISDSDHYFDGQALASVISRRRDADGVIPVFTPPADGIPRWSYSLVEGEDRITAVGEKDAELMRRGAKANIGAYYFSKGRTFLEEVERTIAGNDLTGEDGKKEFYVAPVYQRLIRRGLNIVAASVGRVWGLGTPADLEEFLRECPRQRP